ncbi:universal stress protein [Dactylosporangium sp. AC04546]|uniref:universal stress protein n=1 Tax=Dactylosporangium sp. AC04546 TaxID=2862460 RepID=UPI001EE0A5F0|nr:universal stress protein [Dactylosporangium sp. AC04546]WVK78542.1 universal stress protein [Dactylosporangium sp. AC04546]
MAYEYGPIVVGVDGSADSTGAVRWAADEACRWTRTLVAVHAVEPGEPAKPAEPGQPGPAGGADIAAAAAAEARRWCVGVAATGETRAGPPVDVLRQMAEQARLLVVGGRGTSRHPTAPLGPVSRALAARAGAPVLVVHNARRWASPDAVLPRDGPVVVGFDGSDSAGRALRLAFAEAAARCSRLVILQAWQHLELWRPGGDRAADLCDNATVVHESLCAVAQPWRARYPLVEVEIRGEPGDPVMALTTASQWAGLLVLGTRCPADPVQPSRPSVSSRVLRYAACPVLVAHGPSRVPAAAAA